MGTVAVEVVNDASLVDEVPAVEVIDKTVIVVVLSFGSCIFVGIGPDIVGKIGMIGIDTGINYGYYLAGGIARSVGCPQFRKAYCRYAPLH